MLTSLNLAAFACHPDQSRGRRHGELESATRTCFQRDRDRIIHCSAFRRLQYKTQVFVNHEGDYFRTRLTHSLEVAQIARSVCRRLELNEDLAEALALGHDLGHPPFGHAGEDALNDMIADNGGFDHNAQSLRVVTKLEEVYPNFDGLNLTWETLEGIIKHNGPLGTDGEPIAGYIQAYTAGHDLEIGTYASAEAQVAALADDIAYDNHDIDDGLRAGLFAVADLIDVPLIGPAFHAVRREHPELDENRTIRAAVRNLIGAMVLDVLHETEQRLAAAKPADTDAVRHLGQPVVAFSARMRADEKVLKDFLRVHMYKHFKLNRMTSKAKRLVRDLFGQLVDEPDCLPTEWRQRTVGADRARIVQVVTDYVAGMTDRFATDEHQKLFDIKTKTS